jgi:isoleucyl-tRNA synthetase
MYKKVDTDLNFVAREQNILKFWKDNDIQHKMVDRRKDGPQWTWYDGPPTANGKPHIGHVLTRVIKDIMVRYHTMLGENVARKAGWDTHGLPVELEVEKAIGLDSKEQIEQYGIEPFIKQCKSSVWKYKGMWEDFSDKVGFSADMENPYVTYYNDYIESEWWALKEIWNKKLLYKGFKVVPYCPRCGTPLSSHEVAQGYKTIKERSAIVRFKLQDKDEYMLAWTTTPWTLPSNVALVVNPDLEYSKVKAADGRIYILATDLLDSVLQNLAKEGQKAYTVLSTCKGKDLEYTKYEPLYDFAKPVAESQSKRAFFVMCDSYVTAEDGTGIVHAAPAFGEDDSVVGQRYDTAFLQFVDSKGNMTEPTPYRGMFVKDADSEILKDLKNAGKLFAAPKFEHSYPHCWRCGTPLIYYRRSSWYIKMTAVKDDLIKNNKTINWIPRSIGTGRFGDWLENVQDWAISRNRYWGTPLNIWECECGHQHAIGSIEELKKMSPNCPDDIELHRPYIDDVTITCPVCGKQMHRVPEVIDCWFDSGAMPYAQHHYPFENRELFERQFPADYITEAVDQTRGWFYSLVAESTLLFDRAPFKNVIVMGLVLDAEGQKMSKSKGNAVDPFDALNTYGADAVRWYFYTNSAPWLPNRFHGKAVMESQRKFLGTLWNVYAFYVLYADIDKFDPTKYSLDTEKLGVMDRWILSVLNSTVETVNRELANYAIPEACKALQNFVDDLSNWYVRRSRERFWVRGMTEDKINAYMTLYTALSTAIKTAAPMIPFMADGIYQNIVRTVDKTAPESVHMCLFPKADKDLIDKSLEKDMDLVLRICTLARAARNDANIKNRQPLSTMYIKADRSLNDYFKGIIADELNVKNVEEISDASGYIDYSFKPQLKILGPKYGKKIGEIRKALADLDGSAAKKALDEEGHITISISDENIKLTKEELLISTTQMPGFECMSDDGVVVALDTHISKELLEEGFVREIISKLQTMRKDANFQVLDKINVFISGNEKIMEIAQKNEKFIKQNVLALSINGGVGEYSKQWDINGEIVTLSVEKA